MYPNYSVGVSYGIALPYQLQISPPLSNGTQIQINGTATGSRFEVNLKNYQDDIVLHFNPRFDDNVLVLNSAQRGSWGQEERQALPMHRGIRFTMVITGTDRSFRITVNNSYVCEFYARLPMNLAQLVEVKGDINLESVQQYGGCGFVPSMGGDMGYCPPPPQPTFGGDMGYCPPPPSQPSFGGDMGYCPPPPQPSFGGDMGYCPPPPSSQPAYGFPSAPPFSGEGVPTIHSCHIHTGSRIYVRGFIHPGANRFELNLLQGYSDGDDVAFHFNPRFDSRTIVKNHRQNGQWGQEENQPFPSFMPLVPGSPIDLQIACNTDRYTVYMNNHLIAEYYHKIPAGFVKALQYKGDITVTSVGQL